MWMWKKVSEDMRKREWHRGRKHIILIKKDENEIWPCAFDEAAAVAGPKQYSLNGLVMSLLNFSAQPISYCEWFKQFQIFSMVFCHCSSGKFKLFQLNLDMMELWTVNFSLVPRTKNEMKKHSRIQIEIAIHIVSHNEKEKNELESTFDWLSNFQMTLFK